jgi:putative Holliday junction resolvase
MTATGRVLGLDPGAVRVGVSVSDTTRSMAFPRDPLPAGPELVERVAALVEEEGATTVVVGLPRSLDGSEGTAAGAARALATELEVALDVDVELFDERLTTVQAANALRAAGQSAKQARGVIDSAAATILLEAWMESR